MRNCPVCANALSDYFPRGLLLVVRADIALGVRMKRGKPLMLGKTQIPICAGRRPRTVSRSVSRRQSAMGKKKGITTIFKLALEEVVLRALRVELDKCMHLYVESL